MRIRRKLKQDIWQSFAMFIVLAIFIYLFYTYAFPVIKVWFNANKTIIIISLSLSFILTIAIARFKVYKNKKWFKWIISIILWFVHLVTNNDRISIPIETQKEVIKRANNRCQCKGCKEVGNLEIHHINKNHSDNIISNLIYLCPNHHQRADRNEYKSWQLQDWAKGIYN